MKVVARISILLAFPFRLFFLLGSLYAAVAIVAWIGLLFGHLSLPVGWSAVHWHSHEMLFGLVAAAITGFVLTAVCNWTGVPPISRPGLLGLGLLWLSGRVAMWNAGNLPALLVAIVDVLFLPVVALYLLSILWQQRNTHNYIMAGVIGLLGLTNLCMHVGLAGQNITWLLHGETAALNIITFIMVVIAGRITPAFSANWLRLQGGNPNDVRRSTKLDIWVLSATALMIPLDMTQSIPIVVGVTTLFAALLNGIRLVLWSGWRTAKEPLLWILHIGYAWIVLALLLKGLAIFGFVAASVWQHALGVGAMGTLILGVMTRVSLGHTGRPLHLPRSGITIYFAILLAAVSRVLTALLLVDYKTGLVLTAIGWTLAFALFILIYWPILSSPRVDGRPG
ncbi:MAG: NnrS family protein [Gammaproteobacteria bacterium]|nr:NnrS family protein [Gammaproteobacteria bacterium]